MLLEKVYSSSSIPASSFFSTAVWFRQNRKVLIMILIKFYNCWNELHILEMLFRIKTQTTSIWNCGIYVMDSEVKMEFFFQKMLNFYIKILLDNGAVNSFEVDLPCKLP